MFQRGLGVRLAEVRLQIFHAADLGHVRRACAPEHLMCDAIDPGIVAGLFEDTEKKILGVDGSAAAGWEDKCIRARVGCSAPPEFQFGAN